MVLPFNNPRTLWRAMRNDDAQNKPEDLLMRFDVDQSAGAREGGMIGAAFVESDSRKVADTERIGGPPGDTAFGIDALEIADEEDAEGDARGEAGPAHFLGVELLAGRFGELVELFGVEQFIEPSVKGVSGRGR